MSMNDGITMDDMEDQTQHTMHQVNGNSRLCSETGSKQTPDDAEDLEDLEQSLQALDENLDRSSPDLWPDHIPGVGQYLPATPYLDSDTPRQGEAGSGVSGSAGVLHNLTRDEMETLLQLGNLDVQELMSEVKRLQNIAYQLGQEESKEMTRGKYLNILRRKNSQ